VFDPGYCVKNGKEVEAVTADVLQNTPFLYYSINFNCKDNE
jgi:hypothetical protein